MWDQSVEHKTYQYIDNLFFDSILTSKVYQTFSGCRCRKCEQKVFTLNANGTIGGCPNSAVENSFANIEDPIEKILFSEGRMCNIQTESIRPDPCYTCEVYDLCNGDCHQLGWDGDICAAPKSMMKSVMACNDMKLFKSFLNGFQGQE
jgi:radical SAM protein with 4Fe4S-binding SPASM domain